MLYYVLIFVPLWFGVCAKPTFRYCGKNVLFLFFAFSAAFSRQPAEVAPQNVGGGTFPQIRRSCVISATPAEPAATQKCQFSALLPQIRRSFRRIKCKIRNFCNCYELQVSSLVFLLCDLYFVTLDFQLASFDF
jgi:hypothetical protein